MVPAEYESKPVLFEKLTRVSLPRELRLSDRAAVVDLLGALVREETASNSNYFGAVLFGSVSRAPSYLPKVRIKLDFPAVLNVNLLEHPEQLSHWETMQFLGFTS